MALNLIKLVLELARFPLGPGRLVQQHPEAQTSVHLCIIVHTAFYSV